MLCCKPMFSPWLGILGWRWRCPALKVLFASAIALSLCAPTPAHGQGAAYALNGSESAQRLSQQALDCLHRGEDAVTKDARLAAYHEGLALAQRALQADDLNADAHFAVFANRGRILLLEGASVNPFNLLSVNRDLDRALELNPNHADALAAKGGLYRQLPRLLGGSLSKAEQCLARAIEIDPNAVGARIELAQTYSDMGEPERGVPLLRQAAEVAERVGKYRQLAQARSLLQELAVQH